MNARTQRRKDAKKKGERGRGKGAGGKGQGERGRGKGAGGRKGGRVWGEEEGRG